VSVAKDAGPASWIRQGGLPDSALCEEPAQRPCGILEREMRVDKEIECGGS